MKRLPLRELVLMCAPIALIGGVILFSLWRRSPNIALSLETWPSATFDPDGGEVQFAWQTKVRGGTKDSFRLGYHQRVVAVFQDKEKVIFSDAPGSSMLGNVTIGSGVSDWPPNTASLLMRLQWEGVDIPLAAKRLEWRGEVVAVPREGSLMPTPSSAAQLAKWAKMKGAARVVRTFPIKFDASKNAIKECTLEPVNATNASKGADTCVTTEVRRQARRACRRLVAFDGKTTRILWNDKADGSNRFWKNQRFQTVAGWSREEILFRLRDVPHEWGEIVWLYDVVFLEDQPNLDEAATDVKTLEAHERAGGLHMSRRVVVRAKGQVIAAPVF